jgi:hypothetical protein
LDELTHEVIDIDTFEAERACLERGLVFLKLISECADFLDKDEVGDIRDVLGVLSKIVGKVLSCTGDLGHAEEVEQPCELIDELFFWFEKVVFNESLYELLL